MDVEEGDYRDDITVIVLMLQDGTWITSEMKADVEKAKAEAAAASG